MSNRDLICNVCSKKGACRYKWFYPGCFKRETKPNSELIEGERCPE